MPAERTPVAQTILNDLSPHARQDLLNALSAMHTVASEDIPTGETMDYSGMDRLLRMVHPETRKAILTLNEMAGTERNAPFQPRMNLDDWAATLQLDPDTLAKAKSTLDTASITNGLVNRMADNSNNNNN